jgi:hypothetical protein
MPLHIRRVLKRLTRKSSSSFFDEMSLLIGPRPAAQKVEKMKTARVSVLIPTKPCTSREPLSLADLALQLH